MEDAEDGGEDRSHDEWAAHTNWLHRMYEQIEGYVEDIGFVYLNPVPDAVVTALIARQPWSSEAVAKLLKAIEARATFDSPYPSCSATSDPVAAMPSLTSGTG